MDYGLIQQDALEWLRRKAWDRFVELGLPKSKQEAFQYVPRVGLPSEVAREREAASLSLIEPFLLPECQESRLVFIDGHFHELLSCYGKIAKECVISPLDAAMKTYGMVLQNRLSREIKEEEDCFAALNGAYHGRGLFLYVPPGTVLSSPVQVISILSSPLLMAPRLQIFLGKGAELNLIQVAAGEGRAIDCIDVSLDEASQLNLVDETHLEPPSWLFRNLRATLKKEARLSSFSYTDGSVRHSTRISLNEEGAEARLSGLATLDVCQEAHTHVLIKHNAPRCRSHQHFKSVLQGKSRSSFEGKIAVRPIAQKTEAYQLNQNLLLSEEAAAHAKPNLEIFADDVKASHGATISQLSEEELFYFQSRGISAIEAKQLLLQGFCRELFEKIPIRGLREYFIERLGLARFA